MYDVVLGATDGIGAVTTAPEGRGAGVSSASGYVRGTTARHGDGAGAGDPA